MCEVYAWDGVNLFPVEAWIESDGLIGMVQISGVCHEVHDFTYFHVYLN